MIQERLAEIQKTLRVPKSQFNDFGKYHYRSCEDILEAVKPLLGDAILILSDDLVLIGDRYYIKATATLRFSPEDSLFVTAFAREEADKKGMDAAQITGAVSSYARKYALNGLFLTDDTKDADTTDNTKKGTILPVKPPVTAPPPPLAESAEKPKYLPADSPMKKKIEAMIAEAGLNRDLFKQYLFTIGKLETVDDRVTFATMTTDNASKLIDKWDVVVKAYEKWLAKQAGDAPA